MNPIKHSAATAILGVALVTSHGCWSSQDSLPLQSGGDSGAGDTDTDSDPVAPPCGMAGIEDIHVVGDVAWAVGFGPRALVLEGAALHAVETPTSFTSVWAQSAQEALAAGGDSIYIYEGGEWHQIHQDESAVFFDLWGADTSHFFAVGTRDPGDGNLEPVIWKYQDGAWTEESSLPGAGLETIWGSSPEEIYAAGEQNTTLKYDGSTWSPFPVFPDQEVCIGAVTGTDGDDVWLLGSGAPFMHFDGAHWEPVTVGNSPSFGLNDITGHAASSGVVFALGTGSQAPPVDSQKAHLWRVGLDEEEANTFSLTPFDMEPKAVSAIDAQRALVAGKADGQAVLLEWKKETWKVICR